MSAAPRVNNRVPQAAHPRTNWAAVRLTAGPLGRGAVLDQRSGGSGSPSGR